MLGLLISNRNF